LWTTARTLSRLYVRAKGRGRGAGPLPPLFLVTDPERTLHPVRLARRLPKGAGVIYRAFGAAKADRTAEKLRRVAATRGLILLIGSGEPRVRMAGAHLPERLAHRARRFRRTGALVTAAAHGEAAIRRARLAGCDAVLVSAVFESASPSAGRPMGQVRFAALVRRAGLPVYALGGINADTARRLLRSGAAGLAAVGALAD
jgi:thiamine-phosphate pyrophosphorylase